MCDIWEAIKSDGCPYKNFLKQYFKPEGVIDSMMISAFNDLVVKNGVKGSLFEKKILFGKKVKNEEEKKLDKPNYIEAPITFIANLFNLEIFLFTFTYNGEILKKEEKTFPCNEMSQAGEGLGKVKKLTNKLAIKIFKYEDKYGCLYLKNDEKSPTKGPNEIAKEADRDYEKIINDTKDLYTIVITPIKLDV